MLQVSEDLRSEAGELLAFLKTLKEEDWSRPTPFMNWTPWDVVAHLHYFDSVSLLAVSDADAFAEKRKRLIEKMLAGVSSAEVAKDELGHLDVSGLLKQWYEHCCKLAEALGKMDPKARLPWFGPDMGVPMFTTARYMETWAHGQDVYDLVGVTRSYTDRIKHIAVIGMKTFAWTFLNRKLEVPGPAPHVHLIAPSGAVWEWNEESASGLVRGQAVDFCHVVTQGRNVADTQLVVEGDVAKQWMAIAQCFAGGPADPPKPGERGMRN